MRSRRGERLSRGEEATAPRAGGSVRQPDSGASRAASACGARRPRPRNRPSCPAAGRFTPVARRAVADLAAPGSPPRWWIRPRPRPAGVGNREVTWRGSRMRPRLRRASRRSRAECGKPAGGAASR